ncbi:hypothetical protein ScalyP_jg988, partial [Parmales sp. scaly parma]
MDYQDPISGHPQRLDDLLDLAPIPPPPTFPTPHPPTSTSTSSTSRTDQIGFDVLSTVASTLTHPNKPTVAWQSAVDSMKFCASNLLVHPACLKFCASHLFQVVSILLDQQTDRLGEFESNAVVTSLHFAAEIVAVEVEDCLGRGASSSLVEVLGLILDGSKLLYKSRVAKRGGGHQTSWTSIDNDRNDGNYSNNNDRNSNSNSNSNSNNNSGGFIRTELYKKFRDVGGFYHLARYLSEGTVTTSPFPTLQTMQLVIDVQTELLSEIPVALRIEGEGEVEAPSSSSSDSISTTPTPPPSVEEVPLSSVELTLNYISSPSLPLRLFGWDLLSAVLEEAALAAPPPASYTVSGAGAKEVNGVYHFCGPRVGGDGFARDPKEAPMPVRQKQKTLTLFLCTMKSSSRWWYISEADPLSPGTDKDVDYYQHRSGPLESSRPPSSGWVLCRGGYSTGGSSGASPAGLAPPPTVSPTPNRRTVRPQPPSEDRTLEEEVEEWATRERILEMAITQDPLPIHRE